MLRTLDMLSGYDIQATDGEIGSVDDFLFDDESWKIRYLVVDTGPWLFGRQVLVAPEWIDEIGWERSLVRVKMERDAIKESP